MGFGGSLSPPHQIPSKTLPDFMSSHRLPEFLSAMALPSSGGWDMDSVGPKIPCHLPANLMGEPGLEAESCSQDDPLGVPCPQSLHAMEGHVMIAFLPTILNQLFRVLTRATQEEVAVNVTR